MDNLFQFPSAPDKSNRRKAGEEDSGLPEILATFHKFRQMVDANELDGFVVVGINKERGRFMMMAGLFDPVEIAGLLEHVKIHIVAQ